jgi:hypothetical protein
MSLIATLHLADRETRWRRRLTSIWRTRAKVARSALTCVRKCTSRTSTREFETCPSVAQCGGGGVTTRTADSRWKKFEKLYRTKVNPLAAAKYQIKYKKRGKKQIRLQFLDAMRKTRTRYSDGGPKQKSACARRTKTRDP